MRSLVALILTVARVTCDETSYFCCDIEHCMQVPDASPCPWSSDPPFTDETVCKKTCFGGAVAADPPRLFCVSSADTKTGSCMQACANASFVSIPLLTKTILPGSCPPSFVQVGDTTFDYEQCDDGRSISLDCRPPAKLVNVTMTVLMVPPLHDSWRGE